MNRTDRLYALVEELRAVSPRPRSASWLARRFEVSVRTVERDLGALLESGVPIRATPGRGGGYSLDRTRTLAPLALTAGEATALAVGLRALAGTPFAEEARSAVQKVLAVMPEPDRAAARSASRRVGFVAGEQPPQVPRAISEALTARRVLRLTYADRLGAVSQREVEPLGFVREQEWHLVTWCRLREAVRGFRLDRIVSVRASEEPLPARELDLGRLSFPSGAVEPLERLGA